MMKLYTVPLAPNPTKVMLYLEERAQSAAPLPIEQVLVNTVKGDHKKPEHLARTPFGTVPVLELESGEFIIESLTIIDYLEDQFPDGGLQLNTPLARAKDRELERIVDLRVATPMAIYAHAVKSPIGYPENPVKAAEIKQGMQGALDHIETLLADGRPLLAGSHVSVADFTLQAGLQFLRFIDDDLIEHRSNLRAWDERYRARPAAQVVLKW